jgi:DNA repair exonuclease SbcCD ATPase subunit
MTSLEQAAKALIEELLIDECSSVALSKADFLKNTTPIIAKHMEAFAREQKRELAEECEQRKSAYCDEAARHIDTLNQLTKDQDELAQLKEQHEKYRETIRVLSRQNDADDNEIQELHDKNRELLKDKERIDLLETMNGSIHLCHMNGANINDVCMTGKEMITGATLREALDKAALAKGDV